MTHLFTIHPQNPQERLVRQVAEIIADGGIVAVPTDSSYAFVGRLDDKNTTAKLQLLRGKDHKHHLTLLCANLNEIALYAKLNNQQFKLLKLATPGKYTFLLPATKEVPRRVSQPNKKTIGVRIPEHKFLLALITLYGQPLLSTTLIPQGSDEPLNSADDILELYDRQIAAVVDTGLSPQSITTVIDLTADTPAVKRLGDGDLKAIGIELN